MKLVKEILADQYGLSAGAVTPLNGYSNANFKVETDSANFVLKIYDNKPNIAEALNAENMMLEELSADKLNFFPRPIKTKRGEFLHYFENRNKIARLLTFLEGECIGKLRYTAELMYSFGKSLAHLDNALLNFRDISIESKRSTWDLQQYGLNRRFIRLIENPSDRKLVEYFFLQTREFVEPFFDDLRKSTIHGDANEWNVLARDGKVSGFIDFGDLFYTPLINELAIAVAYATLYVENPIDDILPMIKGYHEVLPLQAKEVELLYYLIPLRLCISVCNSASARKEMPENEYALVSETAAWKMLNKWIKINPLFVGDKLRKAIGFESKSLDSTELDLDLARRHRHSSSALSLQFREPIKMVGAAFQYMYDSRGVAYLDCYNNIPHVGHCHPRVVEAGQKAMARLNTNTRYLNDDFNRYAENLLSRFPDNLTKVFFVNSGSAASDLAIRLALAHTGNQGIIVIERGYHGNTLLGIEISQYKYGGKGGEGKSDKIIEAELPDTFNGRYVDAHAGKYYANDLFGKVAKSGLAVAAFIAEPVVGCGGQVPLAEGYLGEVYPFIRKCGGVCISDEVQTGFGRLGQYFWGFEMHGVEPDIVVLGKPIGNGHPMAAVVTTAEIAGSFESGMEFFSSFGGNTVSCAIGQAVLDVLDEENLPQNAADVGGYLKKLLGDLVEKHDVCGAVRGKGLFLGLELVTDKQTRHPATELASVVKNRLKENSILVGTDGPHDNVIKIKPPLCFSKENARRLAGEIDQILERLR